MRATLRLGKVKEMTFIKRALAKTGPATPARDVVRPLMPEIKEALKHGVSRSAMYDVLTDGDIDIGCSKSGFTAAIRYYLEHPELLDEA